MICVSILEEDINRALSRAASAAQMADVVEIRLDGLSDPAPEVFLETISTPLLFTLRPEREGGRYRGPEKDRLAILARALGRAAYVDLEHDVSTSFWEEFLSRRKGTKLIASCHYFSETPSEAVLRQKVMDLKNTGADLGKLVTYAQAPEDNLRVLSLPLWARRELDFPLIAFTMGPLGRITRLATLFLGGVMTYACLEEESQAAPGQLPVRTLKEMLAWLR